MKHIKQLSFYVFLVLGSCFAFPAFSEQVISQEQAEKQNVISLNQATADELAGHLHGIGIQKAEAIIEWRKKHGEFTNVWQLTEIKGIGEKTVERNRSRIAL